MKLVAGNDIRRIRIEVVEKYDNVYRSTASTPISNPGREAYVRRSPKLLVAEL